MSNRSGHRDLTEHEKEQIVGMQNAGVEFKKIAATVECGKSTAKNHYYRWKQEGNVQKPRTGRRIKINERARRHLIRETKRDRDQTLADITNTVAPQASVRTVQRVLKRAHIRKWIAAERPLLEEKHAAQRLQWALEHRDWTPEQWAKVVWLDECSVEKSPNLRKAWKFRSPGEKWLKECIEPKLGSGEFRIMVWGCFAGKKRGPFAICPPKMNGIAYRDILEMNLPQFVEALYEEMGEEPIFMQDNAKVHTAGIVIEWLNGSGQIFMEWPPYSPDLNPIEHIWRELKIQLQIHHPEIKHLKGGPEAKRAKLAEILPLMWEAIPEERFEQLWMSMSHRCEAVIKAKGWYTKY